jgi:hypothetical protein
MIFRIAKKGDYKVLADIHLECGKTQTDGFMHKLGRRFLEVYYKILLNEKNSIIVIAEDECHYGVGFHSGTTKAEEHLFNLRKSKIRLLFPLILTILYKPKMLKEILFRNRYVSSESNNIAYGVNVGPRAEYWAWRPSCKNPAGSMMLRKVWSNIIFSLGCRSFKLEVDLSNTDVEKYCKAFGCEVLEEKILPDGRKRAVLEQKKVKHK